MRIRLDIADDLHIAAKELTQRDKKSLGQIISELARSALPQSATGYGMPDDTGTPPAPQVPGHLAAYGFYPLPKRGGIVSNKLIDHLRDIEGT